MQSQGAQNEGRKEDCVYASVGLLKEKYNLEVRRGKIHSFYPILGQFSGLVLQSPEHECKIAFFF